jgi:hypothetical protein
MATKTLPADTGQLRELLEQVSALALESRFLLGELREIEDRPELFKPVTVTSFQGGVSHGHWGIHSASRINESLQKLAARAAPVLDYIDLSPADTRAIRRLGQRPPEDRERKPSEAGLHEYGLFLRDLVQVTTTPTLDLQRIPSV